MRRGDMAEAQRLLEELRNILENLQTAQPNSRMTDPMSREMKQAMQDLENMAREQQQLRDETFRDGQNRRMQQGDRNRAGAAAGPRPAGPTPARAAGSAGRAGRGPGTGRNGEQGQQGGQGLGQRQQALRERLAGTSAADAGHGHAGRAGSRGCRGGHARGGRRPRPGPGRPGRGRAGPRPRRPPARHAGHGAADAADDAAGRRNEAGRRPAGRGQAAGPGPNLQRDNDPLGRPTRSRDFSDGRVRVPGRGRIRQRAGRSASSRSCGASSATRAGRGRSSTISTGCCGATDRRGTGPIFAPKRSVPGGRRPALPAARAAAFHLESHELLVDLLVPSPSSPSPSSSCSALPTCSAAAARPLPELMRVARAAPVRGDHRHHGRDLVAGVYGVPPPALPEHRAKKGDTGTSPWAMPLPEDVLPRHFSATVNCKTIVNRSVRSRPAGSRSSCSRRPCVSAHRRPEPPDRVAAVAGAVAQRPRSGQLRRSSAEPPVANTASASRRTTHGAPNAARPTPTGEILFAKPFTPADLFTSYFVPRPHVGG